LADHPRDHTRREQTKTRNLLERLRDREDDILRFARDLRVPFTNNQAEGLVRRREDPARARVPDPRRRVASLSPPRLGLPDDVTLSALFSISQGAG
jgi:hypothetical protein